MTYLEQRGPLGDWKPVKFLGPVVVKKGRLVKAGGLGPLVRAVQEIPHGYQKLTLYQLREVMSPDGRFPNQVEKNL